MKTEYKYIRFVLAEQKPKTSVYFCINRKGGDNLGRVEWYGSWRQYCFMPMEDTVFSASCLKDIQNFILELAGGVY